MFTLGARSDFYEDFDLFDDYAIGFRDNKFYVIYWKDYLNELVPDNFERKAFDIRDVDEDFYIAAYSFYDRSGYKGEYELMIWQAMPAAIQLRPVIMLIEPQSYNQRFSPVEDSQLGNSILVSPNYGISTIISPN